MAKKEYSERTYLLNGIDEAARRVVDIVEKGQVEGIQGFFYRWQIERRDGDLWFVGERIFTDRPWQVRVQMIGNGLCFLILRSIGGRLDSEYLLTLKNERFDLHDNREKGSELRWHDVLTALKDIGHGF